MAPGATRTITGGELVVQTLRAFGVRLVFGVPGGQTLSITDAILDVDEIRFVTVRHEGAASCMADAVGRLTRRPGVCLATTGPGATNLLTGVGGGFRDSSPMLVLTCNNNLRDLDRDDAQAADHVDIFRSLTKWATLVPDARVIPSVLEEAYLRATTGCPGPVLVDFARSALEAEIEIEVDALMPTAGHPVLTIASQRPQADPISVADAARRLAAAKRPVVWLGNGVKLSDASDAALALAEQLEMPVITTFNGIGSVPSGHRLVFGPLSRMGTELSSRVLAEADLLLAVGNSLNAISTSRWTLPLPKVVLQIDVEPQHLGRYYADRTVGLLGDARAVLHQLLGAVGERAVHARSERSVWVESLSEARSDWLARATAEPTPGESGTIAPDRLVQLLRTVCPDDALLVVDAGNPGVWSHLWEVRRPGSYLKPVGFGNMGFALPAAIAAKLVQPGTPVIALVGDGSLGMSMGEIETLGREGVPVVVVVMNDSGYGNIRQEQIVKYGGGRTVGVDFMDVDYAAVGRACGVDGFRATNENELTTVVRDALRSDRPTLIDAPLDTSLNAWTYPLFKQYELEG